MSERKLAEEELKQKSQKLETLTQDLRKLATHLSKEQELSRRKFAKILHEQVGQNLAALKIKCSNILEDTSSDTAEIKESIYDIIPILNDLIDSTRRLSSELYPVVLDVLGFTPAVSWLTDVILKPKKLKVKTNISEFVESLPSEDKLSLFRIVQEAFQNIAKHAFATKVIFKLTKRGDRLSLSIKDNGVGFDLEKIKKRKVKV